MRANTILKIVIPNTALSDPLVETLSNEAARLLPLSSEPRLVDRLEASCLILVIAWSLICTASAEVVSGLVAPSCHDPSVLLKAGQPNALPRDDWPRFSGVARFQERAGLPPVFEGVGGLMPSPGLPGGRRTKW